MNLITFLALLSYFYATIIAQVPINTFLTKTHNYYVTGGNGVQIYVEEKGDPEKTTILLTSGHFTAGFMWDPQWLDPHLYKRFHLVRWDYRGIGRSDKPKDADAYTLNLHANDLDAVVTKIKSKRSNKKIILVGWSYGSITSLTFMKNHPDIKVNGFVSVAGLANFNFTFPKDIYAAITDPIDNFSTVIGGLSKSIKRYTFKMSDQLHALLVGQAALVTPGYRKANINGE